jgi:Family of unknown function (DUF6131)
LHFFGVFGFRLVDVAGILGGRVRGWHRGRRRETTHLSCQQAADAESGPGLVEPSDCWHHFYPSPDRAVHARWKEPQVIILGIVLVVVGLVAAIPILETIGGILVVVGVILWVLGSTGRAIGGRKHYY